MDNAWEWLSRPEIRDKILPPVLGGLALALCGWLVARAKGALGLLGAVTARGLRRFSSPLADRLEVYRRQLDEQIFQVQHPWMKEGQTLDDILVPVVIESDDLAGGIEDWSVVLAQVFRGRQWVEDAPPPRLAVIGRPGSGKSVALKVAAREAWDLPARGGEENLIPVFLTFADYRRHDFDLLDAVSKALESGGFEPPPSRSGGKDTKEFAQSKLREGALLIIVDALDELREEDRRRASRRIVDEFRRYNRTPAIVSCRTAAWHGQFSELPHDRIEMAGFTPGATRRFVREWKFQAPKSAPELLNIIVRQSHIAELARSPLMLTIIAFLYSKREYDLPENRARFYQVCSQALLEEWDLARNPERVNRFERHHKEYALCKLAYNHLRGPQPEADLDEHDAVATIGEVMAQNSLNRSENGKMLAEIRENSGLLIRLPPSGLRFPHQTFLEFFAALYLSRHATQEEVFQLYEGDPQRWREVLLLYIGLSSQADQVSRAIVRLRERHSMETTLAALSDARAVEQSVAGGVLADCERLLRQSLAGPAPTSESSVDLITRLGYVASNKGPAHSERASAILHELLRGAADNQMVVSPRVLEALLLASLRRPKEETSSFVIGHIEDLQLGRILPLMEDRAFMLSARVLGADNLGEDKKLEWIDGLRRARAVGLLLDLFTQSWLTTCLRHACVVALVRLSGTDEFRRRMKTWAMEQEYSDSETEGVWAWWGWPFAQPSGESSGRLMVALAAQLARLPAYETMLSESDLGPADGRVLYLASAIRRANGRRDLPIHRVLPGEPADEVIRLTGIPVLRSIWTKAGQERWKRWVKSLDVIWEWSFGLLLGCGWLACLWAIAGCVTTALGWSSLGLHWPAAAVSCVYGLSGTVALYTVNPARDSGTHRIRDACIFGVSAVWPLGCALSFPVSRRKQFGMALLFACLACAALLLVLFVSESTWIRTYFGAVVLLQAFAATLVWWPGATPPTLGNGFTKALFDCLRGHQESV